MCQPCYVSTILNTSLKNFVTILIVVLSTTRVILAIVGFSPPIAPASAARRPSAATKETNLVAGTARSSAKGDPTKSGPRLRVLMLMILWY